MRSLFLLTVTLCALMTSLYAQKSITDPKKLEELKKANPLLQNPSLKLKGAIERPESYVLKVEARSPRGLQTVTAFLDRKSGALYIGSGYDREGNPIVFPKDFKTVKDAVAFSYGHGPREIYLFTDPECPYCGRFARKFKGKLDDYTVHVIFYPLSFHKKAPAMVEWIMQGGSDAERKARYDKVMLEGSTEYTKLMKPKDAPFAYSPETEKRIQASRSAAAELNLRGTPFLYDANLTPLPQKQLLEGK